MRLGLTVDMEKLDRAKFVGHNPLSLIELASCLENGTAGTKELPRPYAFFRERSLRSCSDSGLIAHLGRQ